VGGHDQDVEIQLFNLQGERISMEYRQPDTNRLVKMLVGTLKSGIYLVQVKGNTVNQQVKIVKNDSKHLSASHQLPIVLMWISSCGSTDARYTRGA